MTTYSPDVAPELEPEVVHWQRPGGRLAGRAGGWRGLTGRQPVSPEAILLAAVGAAAFGAVAIGALAIGALAIGRLAVGRGRFGTLEIDELVVGSFRGPALRLPAFRR